MENESNYNVFFNFYISFNIYFVGAYLEGDSMTVASTIITLYHNSWIII
jgi:hypothetical protein